MPGGDGDKGNDLKEKITLFVDELKKGSTQGSCDVAIKTIDLLTQVIAQAEFLQVSELIKHVANEGKQIQAGDPSENIIGNIIYRVLKIIREECKDQENAENQKPSEAKNVCKIADLKACIIEAVTELKSEIEGCVENIAVQAPNYINKNDKILTIGRSRTVEAFLKNAASKGIKFEVFVSECAPFYQGHEMAKNLAESKINTTLITECQIGFIMPKVNKVLIGTHSFMANGGLKAVTGANIMAVLAKEHGIPVIVCSSLYKLSPLFHSTPEHASFNKFASPCEMLDYDDADLLSKVEVINPIFDYVPPHLVYMIVSNIGAQSVSYVYRLVKDFYHPDDVKLK
ncbi:translation initiation factor eIF-2B subunit beta-like [Physella acuta]|uniref:translation initiation factor eIF-2B subunit beta-like n=1 Tax=Physella acuta TaxID=109671 RepID=UPI0027DDADCD|nr:translation initiation factor eIF-2B subunit beta-like [Physella acuta]